LKQSKPHSEIEFRFDDLVGGLHDALAHAKGNLDLRTTVLPPPAPKLSPKAIRALRNGLKVSQAAFGRLLNVPVITVAKWEAGDRKPSGAALRLMEIAKRSPEVLIGR
jgi:putative transcriptional regulator